MTLPVLPSEQSITPAELAQYGEQIVAWAEQTDDVAEVRESASKWAAITEYVRRTSKEGIADAEAVLRRLEVRVGQLLGPPQPGKRTDLSVTTDGSDEVNRQTRTDLRDMAEHADIVEQVIAESNDESPPSRRKVIAAIRDHKQRHVESAMDAELAEAIEERGLTVVTDPIRLADQRWRNEILSQLGGSLYEILAYRDHYGIEAAASVADDPLWPGYMDEARAVVAFCQQLLAIEWRETA